MDCLTLLHLTVPGLELTCHTVMLYCELLNAQECDFIFHDVLQTCLSCTIL